MMGKKHMKTITLVSKASLSLICLLLCGYCQAQHTGQAIAQPEYPKDNSYNLQSAFAKYQHDYANIQLPVLRNTDTLLHQQQVYSSETGRDLHLQIYQSRLLHKGQAILLIHGGGWHSGHPGLMQPLAQALALQGYVTATLEYRLSPEALYPAALLDINQAVLWLKQHSASLDFEPKQLILLGGSSGGHLAALFAYSAELKLFAEDYPANQVQAVIDLDGVLNVASGEGLAAEDKQGKTDSALARWLGGNFAAQTAKWQAISVPQYISAHSPPMLFIASKQTRFRAGYAEVAEQLEAQGISNQLVVFDDAPHSFWLFEPWFSPTLQKIEQFMQTLEH